MLESVPFGIEGLDKILDGGLVEQSTVLVSGSPGTGKSILGLQYLYNGAREFDDRGLYLTFEEDTSDLSASAASLDFDGWDDLVDDGSITVFDKRDLLDADDFTATLDIVLGAFEEEAVDRLVLDSLTMFQLFFENERERRTYLLKFADVLESNGVTSLFIHEQSGGFPRTEIGLENFLTDGNIYLMQVPTSSGVDRYLWVAKMRKKNIKTDFFPMDIGKGGILVHDSAAQFSMLDGDIVTPF
ncbi:MAG: RAD55 family ATPase [Halobacteriales archaeon]